MWLAGVSPSHGFLLLVQREFWLAAELNPLRLGMGAAGGGALADAAQLEFRGDAKTGGDHLPKFGLRVDNRLGDRDEARAGLADVAAENNQVRGISRETINGWGFYQVAGLQGFHHAAKLRTVGFVAALLFLKDAIATRRLKSGDLNGGVLVIARDARIAENHALLCIRFSHRPSL